MHSSNADQLIFISALQNNKHSYLHCALPQNVNCLSDLIEEVLCLQESHSISI